MGEEIPLSDPMNRRRVLERIKWLWNHGEFKIIGHAIDEMLKDRIETPDLENMIRYGQITEITQPRELWRYRIEGTTVDRRRAACVVEVNGRVVVITAFLLKLQRRR